MTLNLIYIGLIYGFLNIIPFFTTKQNSLILDNLGKEITDGYEISIGDSFLQLGKMKELLYVQQ